MSHKLTFSLLGVCGALALAAPILSGRILQPDQSPWVGLTVKIQSTMDSTLTDAAGFFQFGSSAEFSSSSLSSAQSSSSMDHSSSSSEVLSSSIDQLSSSISSSSALSSSNSSSAELVSSSSSSLGISSMVSSSSLSSSSAMSSSGGIVANLAHPKTWSLVQNGANYILNLAEPVRLSVDLVSPSGSVRSVLPAKTYQGSLELQVPYSQGVHFLRVRIGKEVQIVRLGSAVWGGQKLVQNPQEIMGLAQNDSLLVSYQGKSFAVPILAGQTTLPDLYAVYRTYTGQVQGFTPNSLTLDLASANSTTQFPLTLASGEFALATWGPWLSGVEWTASVSAYDIQSQLLTQSSPLIFADSTSTVAFATLKLSSSALSSSSSLALSSSVLSSSSSQPSSSSVGSSALSSSQSSSSVQSSSSLSSSSVLSSSSLVQSSSSSGALSSNATCIATPTGKRFNFSNGNTMLAGYSADNSNILANEWIVPVGTDCNQAQKIASVSGYNVYLVSAWQGASMTNVEAAKVTGTINSSSSSSVSSSSLSSSSGSSSSSVTALGQWFTKAMFEQLFPNRNLSSCIADGNSIYTYENFMQAASRWPSFGTTGDELTRKRELAGVFAHYVQETGSNVSDPTSGLCWVRERCAVVSGSCLNNYNQDWSGNYPPVDGQYYYGRGPKQLSWPGNYGWMSKEVYGDKTRLLNNPSLVATDGVVAFETSLWFWNQRSENWTSDVATLHQVMTAGATYKGYRGFGATTQMVNGALECFAGNQAMTSRANNYIHFQQALGIPDAQIDRNNIYCPN